MLKKDYLIIMMLDCNRIQINYITADGNGEYCIIADNRKNRKRFDEVLLEGIRESGRTAQNYWKLFMAYANMPGYGNGEWHCIGSPEVVDIQRAKEVDEIMTLVCEYHDNATVYKFIYKSR